MAKEKEEKKNQAIAFVSAADKTQDGVVALELQRQEINRYASKNNTKIVEWVEVPAAGWNSNMGVILEAVDRQSSINKLLIHRLFRMTRYVDDYFDIKRELAYRNVAICSVLENLDDEIHEFSHLLNLAHRMSKLKDSLRRSGNGYDIQKQSELDDTRLLDNQYIYEAKSVLGDVVLELKNGLREL